jgi:hypothetical protein
LVTFLLTTNGLSFCKLGGGRTLDRFRRRRIVPDHEGDVDDEEVIKVHTKRAEHDD